MPPRKRKRPSHIGGMPTVDMTPGQVTILTDIDAAIKTGRRIFTLLYGGVRAGKSTCAALGLTLHSKTRTGCEYIIGAYTQRQAMAIFMPKFKTAADLLGLSYDDSRGSNNPHIEIGENLFSIYGGSDAGRDRNVQGLTIAGLLLDEIPLLNKEFIHQNEARASEPGAIRIYTANKVHPYHWTTKYYFDRARKGSISATLYDLNTADNQHIGQDYIDERIEEYDAVHRTRFIDNEFALDRPPLYTTQFDDSEGDSAISVIYGDGNTVYVLNAVHAEYGYCVTGIYEYGAGTTIADMILGPTVLVNSDRPMLAKYLRRAGKAVRGYSGDYEARRLEQTQYALNTGLIRFSPELDNLTEAVDEYHTGGIYKSPLIRNLEAMGEYANKRKARV